MRLLLFLTLLKTFQVQITQWHNKPNLNNTYRIKEFIVKGKP